MSDTKKILFVVTSHGELGDTGKPTGMHFSEMADPYEVLHEKGYSIDFVSPKGGKVPLTDVDETQPTVAKIQKDPEVQSKLENSMTPEQVDATNYDAVYFVGGHGTMWDFPENQPLADLAAKMYESGKVVAAVCHGPSALVNVKLSDGKYLVEGKTVAAFTDEEEKAIELDNVVPFLLASKLVQRGANHTKAPLWQANVEVDERLVTGQNPASARRVGEAIAKLLE